MNETEAILHAEALKREAQGYLHWRELYAICIGYNPTIRYRLVGTPRSAYQSLTEDELYQVYKKNH